MANTDKTNILERLAEGITQLTSSERWQEWLAMQSRFHSYSFNNTLLILGQKPEATRVAGFNAWRKLDRFVRKGEKGIWILAPMVYKSDAETRLPQAISRPRSSVGSRQFLFSMSHRPRAPSCPRCVSAWRARTRPDCSSA